MSNRVTRLRRLPVLCAVIGLVGRGVTAGGQGHAIEVTPVTGPSTLHRLDRTIETSPMGWAGQWSRSPLPDRPVPSPARARALDEMVVWGGDLYRVSCRACHRPDGSGSPPAVNTILDPVRAASDQWMTARMKEKGRPSDHAYIHGLTSANEADLRKRFRNGGHAMPSFEHLSDDEIGALRPYLDQLAGLPGAETRQRSITESRYRVGELVVKGTCHICHDAVGREDVQTTVLSGFIPPLSAMLRLKSFGDFVHKVRTGAPVPLRAGGVMVRGRMPTFDYLSEQEVSVAYEYLIRYRPN